MKKQVIGYAIKMVIGGQTAWFENKICESIRLGRTATEAKATIFLAASDALKFIGRANKVGSAFGDVEKAVVAEVR